MIRAMIVFLLLLPATLWAQDRDLRLYVAEPLVESGLTRHILPRFSLKTQVRVTLVERGQADLSISDQGAPLFDGLGQTWALEPARPDHPAAAKLAKWLRSDVGRRTVYGFAPEGEPLFSAPSIVQQATVETAPAQDITAGLQIARRACVRCHAVEAGRSGIGSTPSFAVLRSLPDWETRFATFFALNPHPSFTQIPDVTDPFPIDRPSPIAELHMDLTELDALLTYVRAMAAADLGKPLEHQ
jgi:cytochrome c553